MNLACVQVDELGRLRAQIADLKRQEEQLVTAIKASGAGAYDGTMFRAVVSVYEQTHTDWRAVAEKLEPSRQLIAAHTDSIPVTKLVLMAKK